ncbi:MAG: hypothetical protein MJ168_05120 [Clostridia bacterium]|nr:hypothetical protein [Clostridia bacterium]
MGAMLIGITSGLFVMWFIAVYIIFYILMSPIVVRFIKYRRPLEKSEWSKYLVIAGVIYLSIEIIFNFVGMFVAVDAEDSGIFSFVNSLFSSFNSITWILLLQWAILKIPKIISKSNAESFIDKIKETGKKR